MESRGARTPEARGPARVHSTHADGDHDHGSGHAGARGQGSHRRGRAGQYDILLYLAGGHGAGRRRCADDRAYPGRKPQRPRRRPRGGADGPVGRVAALDSAWPSAARDGSDPARRRPIAKARASGVAVRCAALDRFVLRSGLSGPAQLHDRAWAAERFADRDDPGRVLQRSSRLCADLRPFRISPS